MNAKPDQGVGDVDMITLSLASALSLTLTLMRSDLVELLVNVGIRGWGFISGCAVLAVRQARRCRRGGDVRGTYVGDPWIRTIHTLAPVSPPQAVSPTLP